MSKKVSKSTENRIAERLLKGEPIGESGIIFNGLELREVEEGDKQTEPRKTKETEAVEVEKARAETAEAGEGAADIEDTTPPSTTTTTDTTATATGGKRVARPSTGNTSTGN